MGVAISTRRVGNLPADVTSFVGRRAELAELKRLLSASRLVTLTGVGGVGKTRLALRAAAELRRAHDAIWLIDLAGLSDPALVAQTVANTLGLRSTRRPGEALGEFLAPGTTLLILDNCEHLVDACCKLADRLLRAAPGLRIMATSRQPLGVTGEQVLPVLPLPVPARGDAPTLSELERYDAVTLFADRAAAAAGGFTVDDANRTAVAALCRELEGIPLAIELAAVRLRAFSVSDLARRIDDRYRLLTGGSRAALPRQRTLHALVDWSFQLLPPAERTLWLRLSVFAGNFDLESAEIVCGGGEVVRDMIFDQVNELVDKSILLREESDGGVRYRMLETLREFGREHLDEAELRRLRCRHRDRYLRLAETAAREWFGPDQAMWAGRLRAEQANLRAALEFCLDAGQAETGLRIATLLQQPHWLAGSFFNEGRHMLERLLDAAPDPSVQRTRGLWACAWLALMQDDTAAALPMIDESRRLAERLHDAQSLAYTSYLRGLSALFGGDVSESMRLVGEALEAYSAADDLLGITMSAMSLARAMSRRGQAGRAHGLYETALSLTERYRESWCRHWVLTVLALEAWERGEARKASDFARESLLIDRDVLDDRQNMAADIEILAWIAADEGDHERAAALLGTADTMARSVAASFLPIVGEKHHNRCADRVCGALGEDRYAQAREDGRSLSLPQALDLAFGRRVRTQHGRPAEHAEPSPLTPRETEVARLVANGLSNKEIAATLVIAQRTAEGHVEHILSKLGFTSRSQIAAWFSE